jgi:preprotein translocase subunit YajC
MNMHRLRSCLALLLIAVLCASARAESNGQPAPPGPAATQGAGDTAPPASGGASMGQYKPEEQGTATAGGAAGTKGQGAGQPTGGMPPYFFLIILAPIVLMMWMSSRSQKKEERRLAELRNAVKRGDRVVTIGGMHGEVMTSGEGTIDLRLGSGDSAPVVTFNKSAIATVAGADKAK